MSKRKRIFNKEKLTFLLEAVTKNAGVWYWNCHWRDNVSYMGERLQKDFNLPEEIHDFAHEMLRLNIVDKHYQSDFLDMCEKIIAGKKEAQCIVKGYFPDGTTHWMEFKLSNIYDEDGMAQEAIGIMHLVDDVKEMERKYEIERRHALEDRNLLAHACYNISEWKELSYGGQYLFDIGKQAHTIEGIGEAIALEALDDAIKEDIKKMHNREYLLNAFAEGNTEYSYEYQRKLENGQCIWVHSFYHLMPDQNGTDILLYEYCYDINMKKTMNILMNFAVNDDYDMMGFVNTQDQKAIMMYGKNSYNPRSVEILEDDYQSSLINFATNAVEKSEREEYLEKANLHNVCKYLENHDDLEIYFNVEKIPGQIQAKKVRYLKYREDENCIIFIQSDITQVIAKQKENQDILEAALKNARIASEAKTSFLSQMSHEIRTPMNAIIGMTKLAQQAEDKDEIAGYLNQIDSSSQYLLGIINDILDMSRIESGKLEMHPQWINLSKIIAECIDMLKPSVEKKKIHFIYPEFNKALKVRFWMDPLRVQQIYMNLLNNAIKFTPEGGTIELTLKNIEFDGKNGRDRIIIRDTGCGMSEEFLTRIFKPFEMEENEFSSQVQGTGLGLALVKSFVTQMGGTITVESKLHQGSTFTIEIPYEAKQIEVEQETKNINKIVSLKERRVLLVDDHPLNREIAKKLLEHEQAKVVTAEDGVEACEKFQESANGYYDVILMDIRMPKMDGLEATKEIRKMSKEDAKTIPIIAMTANAFDEDVSKSLEAGMNAHLAKPIEPEKLMYTLEQYID